MDLMVIATANDMQTKNALQFRINKLCQLNNYKLFLSSNLFCEFPVL